MVIVLKADYCKADSDYRKWLLETVIKQILTG